MNKEQAIKEVNAKLSAGIRNVTQLVRVANLPMQVDLENNHFSVNYKEYTKLMFASYFVLSETSAEHSGFPEHLIPFIPLIWAQIFAELKPHYLNKIAETYNDTRVFDARARCGNNGIFAPKGRRIQKALRSWKRACDFVPDALHLYSNITPETVGVYCDKGGQKWMDIDPEWMLSGEIVIEYSNMTNVKSCSFPPYVWFLLCFMWSQCGTRLQHDAFVAGAKYGATLDIADIEQLHLTKDHEQSWIVDWYHTKYACFDTSDI